MIAADKTTYEDSTGHVRQDDVASEVTFSTFILSLWSSAMEQLGLTADRDVGPDLNMVKNVIDVMVMLRHKTKGGLTEDEQTLLDDLIYELRMKYLLKTK